MWSAPVASPGNEKAEQSPWTWRVRAFTVFLAVSALLFANAAPASAVFYYWGMNFASYQMKPYGLNSTWTVPMDAARGNWNSASSEVNITLNSSASARVSAVNFPTATWFGQYNPEGLVSFHIQLNQPRISTYSPFATSLRSGFAHELGHSLCLGDNPGGAANSSLMNYNRNRMTIIGPTSSDVAEANSYYN